MAPVPAPAIVNVLSYVFAAVLALGGVMGFVTKQSVVSLVMGIASGAAVGALELYFSNSAAAGDAQAAWNFSAILVVVAAILAVVMGVRWNKTQKFMPAGLVCGLASCMAAVYFLRLAKAHGSAGLKEREL